MSRYIDAEWLKELYKPYQSYSGKELAVPIGAILANIDDAPSIDIVFCKECMHQAKQTLIQGEIYDMPCCKKGMRISNDNGFCSYGEREGE